MTTEPHDHEHMHEYDSQHHHPHRDDQDDTITYYRLMESAVRDLLIEKKIINEDQIVSWEWNFGDGSQSNISSPQHTYNDYGLYTVELVVMNEFGLY